MSLLTKKGRQALTDWIAEATGETVQDFTTSFASGLVLLKIISHYNSDIISDVSKYAKGDPSENLDLAFDMAAEKLGIDHPLTSKDFVLDDAKKMKEFYKFVGQLFKHYNPNHELFQKKASTKIGAKFGSKLQTGKKGEKGGDDEEEEEKDEPVSTTLTQVEEKIAQVKIEEPVKQEPVQEPEPEKEVVLCEECETSAATKFCADCDTKQCDECADKLHQVKKRKGHSVVALQNMETAKPSQEPKKKETSEDKSGRCVAHPEEKIVAYCKTCDEPICASCMLKKHDGHQKLDLVTAKSTVSVEYDNMLKDIKTTNENITQFHVGLTENNKICTEEVKKYFESIRSVLNKKEETLLQKLNEFHSANETKLVEEEDLLKSRIQKMESEQNFVEQLKLKVDAKVEMKRLNEDSTKVFCDTYLFECNPTYASLLEKTLDIKQSDSKLTLSKLKAGSKAKPFVISESSSKVEEKNNTPSKTNPFKK